MRQRRGVWIEVLPLFGRSGLRNAREIRIAFADLTIFSSLRIYV